MLLNCLYKSAQTSPQKTALAYNNIHLNYSNFLSAIDHASAELEDRALPSGSRVVLMMPGCLDFAVYYFALLQCGMVVVPARQMKNKDDLIALLDETGAQLIIGLRGDADMIERALQGSESCNQKIISNRGFVTGNSNSTRSNRDATHERETQLARIAHSKIAAITYGHSDAPRIALQALNNISEIAKSICEILYLNEDDCVVTSIPQHHSFGMMLALNVPIVAGARIAIPEQLNAEGILQIIEKQGGTCLFGFPALFDAIVALKPEKQKLESVRLAVSCGSHLKSETYSYFIEHYNIEILEAYGLTEYSPLVACNRVFRAGKKNSAGFPMPEVEIAILDQNQEMTRCNEIGEIVIKGRHLFAGYLQAGRMIENGCDDSWFHTGDTGYIDGDGYLFVLGKSDELIYRDGFCISPHEIESKLQQLPQVKAASVQFENQKHKKMEIMAFILPEDGDTFCEKKLIEFCKKELEVYKRPTKFERVKEFPVNAAGTILKQNIGGTSFSESTAGG